MQSANLTTGTFAGTKTKQTLCASVTTEKILFGIRITTLQIVNNNTYQEATITLLLTVTLTLLLF